MDNNLKFKDGFPLNDDGSEKTAEELQLFIREQQLINSPWKLEDAVILHHEPLDEWAKRNGYISLEDVAKKRNVNLDEIIQTVYETKKDENHRSGLSQGQQKGIKTRGDRIPRSSGPGTSDDPQVEEGL